jgi:hypothetical protein
MRAMELDSIECVSYSDGMEEDDDEGAPAAPAPVPQVRLHGGRDQRRRRRLRPRRRGGAADAAGHRGARVPPSAPTPCTRPSTRSRLADSFLAFRFGDLWVTGRNPLRDPVPTGWDLDCPCVGSWSRDQEGGFPTSSCTNKRHGVIRTPNRKT